MRDLIRLRGPNQPAYLQHDFGGLLRGFANDLGVSHRTVESWLRPGDRLPEFSKILSIAGLCGVTFDWLLAGQGPQFRQEAAPQGTAELIRGQVVARLEAEGEFDAKSIEAAVKPAAAEWEALVGLNREAVRRYVRLLELSFPPAKARRFVQEDSTFAASALATGLWQWDAERAQGFDSAAEPSNRGMIRSVKPARKGRKVPMRPAK